MKNVTRKRISTLGSKKDTVRKLVLFCCILFFFFESALPLLMESNSSDEYHHLVQTSSGALVLESAANSDISKGSKYPQAAVQAQQTPFFFKKIPLNTCTKKLLLTISGVGPALANSILETREAIGTFESMQDLLLVPGIGQSRMHKFAKSLSFEITPNLNYTDV